MSHSSSGTNGIDVPNGMSDILSELSDASYMSEQMDIDGIDYFGNASEDAMMSEADMDWIGDSGPPDNHSTVGHFSHSPELEECMEDTDEMEIEEGESSEDSEAPFTPSSSLESLPTEIIQKIAVCLGTDRDLSSLIRTSSALYETLHSDDRNCIWRQRFLTQYDYPHIADTSEFSFAYKLRQFVLGHFDAGALENGLKHKCGHQLDVVKDMILETYNPSHVHGSSSNYSKNLRLFSAPKSPAWLVKLLGCALFGNERTKYGKPNFLFDTVQVVLSHLVLSQRCSVLPKIPSSRDNYNLAQVYSYNTPFKTILEVLDDDLEESSQSQSSRSPGPSNLGSPPQTPELEDPHYKLNMHAILHIRNFWQRHFNQNAIGIGENTYASMVRGLSTLDIEPRQWDQPLTTSIPFNTKWYGHYSCIHPWPKNREDLEERQSCAEDWDSIDPMFLDLETSLDNDESKYWPEAFSSIPAFADSMPNKTVANDYNLTYIRGIASFMEIKDSKSLGEDSEGRRQKWHPFLSSRINGFVCDIPTEAFIDENAQCRRLDDFGDQEDRPIAGWKHICMVLWKPTTAHLLAILDHAEENYGGASGIQISADLNTASIWNDATNTAAGSAAPGTDATTGQNSTPLGYSNNTPATTSNITAVASPTDAEVEAQMKVLLARRIKEFSKNYAVLRNAQVGPPNEMERLHYSKTSSLDSKTATTLPPLFSPQHIRELEESFSQARYMEWDDGTIDYAYAYEGVVIPGGKIMMGRWWRTHGIEGLGPGREIGTDGVGVEVRPIQKDSEPSAKDADSEADASGESSDVGKRKRKGKDKVKTKTKRDDKAKQKRKKPCRRGKKRKARSIDSDEEFVDTEDDIVQEPQVEYEFVTVVNGEESRAVNGCKGLERGPFVFWTG